MAFDAVTLKPQVRELKKAVNGDHTVRFSFPYAEFQIQGEPDGAEWDPDDDQRGSYRVLDIDGKDVTTVVLEDGGEHTIDAGGATLTITADRKEVD